MTDRAAGEPHFGPWNPGISSQIPAPLRGLSTLYRAENSFTSVAKADEMHDLTGVERSALVAFRPSRLALHEVLIRVTADLSVPDGSRIEDLGINFRRMTRAILARAVDPNQAQIAHVYESVRKEIGAKIDAELAWLFAVRDSPSDAAPARPPTGLGAFFKRRRAPPAAAIEAVTEETAVASWEAKGLADDNPLHRGAYRALAEK